MKRLLPLAALALAAPLPAQEQPPSPNAIVNAAPQDDWTVIAPEDLLVMELAADAEGKARQVVIQLMPPPFSQGWVANIRTLAAAHYWDGTGIYRVQDNYVTQWGDLSEEKPLPAGLKVVPESEYVDREPLENLLAAVAEVDGSRSARDPYAAKTRNFGGWPVASAGSEWWPVHCYGMVGVARSLDNTGMGTDLYTVIGHAPRQLDRNIAVVGRVIAGIEHLSSLPRGKGELGFYDEDEAAKRVPILSVRLGSELPEAEQPQFEYLSTESESFAAYAHARANRQDLFYKVPAGGADICNIPVPVRAFEYGE